jgi:predicted nucleic acid-binding protein
MTKLIQLDSNIFIRLIIGDVPDHLEKSKMIFHQIEEEKIKTGVSILVVNEVVWILEKFYELERKIYIPQLLKLLALKNISVNEVKKEILIRVLKKMLKNKYDFTDNYLSVITTANAIYSFDKDFENLFKKR